MICVLYNNTQKNARKNTKKDRKNPKKHIISMNNAFNNLCEVSNSRIAKLPVIKQFDKLGGVIYGVLEGIIIIYLVLAIISFISPMIGENIIAAIDESMVGSMLYNNNLLLKIIF